MPGSERPTIAPPFDPEAFARESESKLRSATGKPAESEVVRRARPAAIDRAGVPSLAISFSELTSRALDHRRGFLLSLVDGSSSIDTLLDLSGMPEEEALELFAELVSLGILSLR
jgi:hypothetical protein